MPKRVQSPSSINTFKQCPRRYYYQYIKKLPTYPNIYTVRGNIVHSALERFFEINPDTIDPSDFKPELASYLSNLFEAFWRKRDSELNRYTKSPDQKKIFYDESRMMLGNWLNSFFDRLKEEMNDLSFAEAFDKIKPVKVEVEYRSEKHSVRGFIDVIEENDGEIKLVDYKTSKVKKRISKEYKLQLSIYALLYKEKHGVLPSKVSIWFLRGSEEILPVDEQMVKDAAFEIEQIHFATESSAISDYKTNITPLCKWSNGQCDFYDFCIKDRNSF
ncbi:MAG: RecB family exonuclease [Candidatus Nanoarchaeia archaeon]